MKHPERVEDYLEHIAEMIEYATSFVQGVDSAELLKRDFKTQAAIVRCIEVIGEAATKIQQQNPAFVKSNPDVPWREMRDMRNKIIHEYFQVDVGAIWKTAKDDLPKLGQQINALIPPKPEYKPEEKPPLKSFEDLNPDDPKKGHKH